MARKQQGETHGLFRGNFFLKPFSKKLSFFFKKQQERNRARGHVCLNVTHACSVIKIKEYGNIMATYKKSKIRCFGRKHIPIS